jgi:uncharacterized protein (TIRG00374 family)
VQRFAKTRRFLHTRTWVLCRFVIGLALGLAALDSLNGKRGELSGGAAELAHLHVFWLVVAISFELISYLAWGQLQRRLLNAGGVSVSIPYAFGISLAAGAIANSLPGGPGFASLYSFRCYRRSSANVRVAVWTLLATLVSTTLALCMIATVGVFLAFDQSSDLGLVGIIFSVFALAVIADAVLLQRRWLFVGIVQMMRLSRRLTTYPSEARERSFDRLVTRLASIKMSWLGFFDTLVASLALWAFDCAALAASFLCLGIGVPWRGLLLTYGASQLAVNLPITPGGLGVVEGTMTIALVAFGGTEHDLVAAVLCYRIVSFWGFLPLGWASWTLMAVVGRRQDRALLPSELAPVGEVAREE